MNKFGIDLRGVVVVKTQLGHKETEQERLMVVFAGDGLTPDGPGRGFVGRTIQRGELFSGDAIEHIERLALPEDFGLIPTTPPSIMRPRTLSELALNRIPEITIVSRRTIEYVEGGEYVGRAHRYFGGYESPLANPFHMGKDGTRDEVIAKYRVWLEGQLRDETTQASKELARLLLLAQKGRLTLICWCVPLSCHAEVIREKILEFWPVWREDK